MSKVTFRAKALEHNKKMPVYKGDEIPEVTDFAVVSRTVPEMPTGMEKEEETQHHLQKALTKQQAYGSVCNLIIPTPDLRDAEQYERAYSSRAGFRPSKKFIHVQPSMADQELPDYDMDSDDEDWLNCHASVYGDLDSNPIRFESMMDKLEKGSGHTVMSMNEAKALIKEKEDVVIAVYDYWLSKRLNHQTKVQLLLSQKKDNISTAVASSSLSSSQSSQQTSCAATNPYTAFRKRAEKMQTRKNRKNDEQSYQGMLQLRRGLEKVMSLLKLLRMREASKKMLLEAKRDICEKRYQLRDWSGELVAEAESKVEPVQMSDLLRQSGGAVHTALSSLYISDDNCFMQNNRSENVRVIGGPLSSATRRHFHQPQESSHCGRTDTLKGRRVKRHHHHKRHNNNNHHQSQNQRLLQQVSVDGSDNSDYTATDEDDADYRFKRRDVDEMDDADEVERLARSLSYFKSPHSSAAPSCYGADVDAAGAGDDNDDEDDDYEFLPDGKFSFKRKAGCCYQAPIPFDTLTDDGGDDLFRYSNQVFAPGLQQPHRDFSLTHLNSQKLIGRFRQRIGRGGRVILDRVGLTVDPCRDNSLTLSDRDPCYHRKSPVSWKAPHCHHTENGNVAASKNYISHSLAHHAAPSSVVDVSVHVGDNGIGSENTELKITDKETDCTLSFPERARNSAAGLSPIETREIGLSVPVASSTTLPRLATTLPATACSQTPMLTSSVNGEQQQAASMTESSRTIARVSRASFVLSSSSSGYKRKYAARTDSEDSGVCSPSPVASSLPVLLPVPRHNGTTARQSELSNNFESSLVVDNSDHSREIGKVGKLVKKNKTPTDDMEVDDGICDDHATNIDCGMASVTAGHIPSVTGHKHDADAIHSNEASVESSSIFDDHPIFYPIAADSDSPVFVAVAECKRLKIEGSRNNGVGNDPMEKIHGSDDFRYLPSGCQLTRQHLTNFDNNKYSLIASKMKKDGNCANKVNLTRNVNGHGSSPISDSGNGRRYEFPMVLSVMQNLSNLSGETVTALEVS